MDSSVEMSDTILMKLIDNWKKKSLKSRLDLLVESNIS